MIVRMAPRRRESSPAGPGRPGAAPSPPSAEGGLRARLGGLAVLLAVGTFGTVFGLSVSASGTAYVWHLNMISDLGDTSCHVRDHRWICSPGHDLFNTGLVLTGGLLAAAGGLLRQLWGRALAWSVAAMGVGLVVAGVFTATEHAALHLVGVVLAIVVPGLGLLWSAIRPATAWLDSSRVVRGLLAGVALVLAAESRLPDPVVPRGAGELVMVLCLVAALVVEVTRLRPGSGRPQGPTSRSAGGTGATGSPSRRPAPRNGASARR